MRATLRIALASASLLSLACDSGTQAPIAFPVRAYVGETVSFAISSDNLSVSEGKKSHDVSKENVEIRLTAANGNSVTVTPRSVIAGASATGTQFAEQNGVSEILVATFDVPEVLPASFVIPGSLSVTARRISGGEVVGGSAVLEILGPSSEGNGPTVFFPDTAESQLQPRPSLRVRAISPGFDASWVIGSVQFEIAYPASVSNPRAFARLKAARGVAYAKNLAPGVARVVIVDPRGFQLTGGLQSGDLLGGGPFVDVIFNQSAPFEASEFAISNLLVTDLDGNVLVQQIGDSSSFFELYARANQ